MCSMHSITIAAAGTWHVAVHFSSVLCDPAAERAGQASSPFSHQGICGRHRGPVSPLELAGGSKLRVVKGNQGGGS